MPKYLRTAETPAVVKDQFGFFRSVAKDQEVETFTILKDGWTKTSDEPYYALGKIVGTFTAPTTVSDLLQYKFIEITPSADGITVKANAPANPYAVPLAAEEPYVIDNTDGVIEKLVFDGNNDILVVGYPR